MGTDLFITVYAAAVSSTQAVFLHGVVGGLSSSMQGGSFSSGFISGAVGKATTVGIADNIQNVVGKRIVVTISGGIVAELGGGKFSNGAKTAAMGYLLNELSKPTIKRSGYQQAKCENSSDCINKVIYEQYVLEERFEKLGTITGPPTMNPNVRAPVSPLGIALITVDVVSSQLRYRYVDVVNYYYYERLYDYVEIRDYGNNYTRSYGQELRIEPTPYGENYREVLYTFDPSIVGISSVRFDKR